MEKIKDRAIHLEADLIAEMDARRGDENAWKEQARKSEIENEDALRSMRAEHTLRIQQIEEKNRADLVEQERSLRKHTNDLQIAHDSSMQKMQILHASQCQDLSMDLDKKQLVLARQQSEIAELQMDLTTQKSLNAKLRVRILSSLLC